MGIFRAGLALGHLITLLFTDTDYLIRPVSGRPDPLECSGFESLSLYCRFSSENLEIIRWLGILVCLLCISGYLPRLSSLLFAWLCFSAYMSWAITDGGDQLVLNLSLAIVLLNLVENRSNQWQSPQALGPFRSSVGLAAVWLIKVQAFVVYFQAGVAKAGVDNWANGTEVYYDLMSPMFGATGLRLEILEPFLHSDIIVQSLTWGTMVVEVGIAFATFAAVRYRRIAWISAIILHLGIAIFMGLISFSIIMISLVSFSLLPSGMYPAKRKVSNENV